MEDQTWDDYSTAELQSVLNSIEHGLDLYELMYDAAASTLDQQVALDFIREFSTRKTAVLTVLGRRQTEARVLH